MGVPLGYLTIVQVCQNGCTGFVCAVFAPANLCSRKLRRSPIHGWINWVEYPKRNFRIVKHSVFRLYRCFKTIVFCEECAIDVGYAGQCDA